MSEFKRRLDKAMADYDAKVAAFPPMEFVNEAHRRKHEQLKIENRQTAKLCAMMLCSIPLPTSFLA